MKLVRADGHQQQQWALSNKQTQTIAQILSEHIDNSTLVRAVARVLQNLNGEYHTDLEQKLADIRGLYEFNTPEEPDNAPDYIVNLLQAIYELYHQPLHGLYQYIEEQINSLRGAVVERLGLELIRYRYQHSSECANSRRFVDQHNRIITLQEVDIAALSHIRLQLEGYECKMKAVSLENHDCVDLEYLHKAGIKENYQVNVGIISFDASSTIKRRLNKLQAAPCIQAYGVETLNELEYSPFE
jgi:hypothetical protein